ncbi:RNA-directed DNA polymerase, eukaryota, reverse transcriptase zinc-binding domain protein [Tanacetum coccineum]
MNYEIVIDDGLAIAKEDSLGKLTDSQTWGIEAGGVDNKGLNESMQKDANGLETKLTQSPMDACNIVKEGSKKWEFTICRFFVGYNMSIQELNNNLYRLWGTFGLKSIIANSNGVFLFKFRNEEGIQSVIENGPWMVNGKPMFV